MEQTCPVSYNVLIGDQLKKRHLDQMREKCQPPLIRNKIHEITYPYINVIFICYIKLNRLFCLGKAT